MAETNDVVLQVAEELLSNPNGAYALAVRLCSADRSIPPDKVMERALAYNKANMGKSKDAASAFDFANVEFPSQEDLTQQLLEKVEVNGGLTPDSLLLVGPFVALLVEERMRMLELLGVKLV